MHDEPMEQDPRLGDLPHKDVDDQRKKKPVADPEIRKGPMVEPPTNTPKDIDPPTPGEAPTNPGMIL